MSGITQDQSLRDHLTRLLDWPDARADFERVVADLPAQLRGVRPDGLPYSLWQLLEHVRLADYFFVCCRPCSAWAASSPRRAAPRSHAGMLVARHPIKGDEIARDRSWGCAESTGTAPLPGIPDRPATPSSAANLMENCQKAA